MGLTLGIKTALPSFGLPVRVAGDRPVQNPTALRYVESISKVIPVPLYYLESPLACLGQGAPAPWNSRLGRPTESAPDQPTDRETQSSRTEPDRTEASRAALD